MSKPTEKQERFALALIETGNATEAYRRAYATARMAKRTVHRRAGELRQHPNVVAIVAGAQRAHRERHAVTVDGLCGELDEARDLALAQHQPAAAAYCSMSKARLHGIPGKGGGVEAAPLDHLTPEELDKYVARLERELEEAEKPIGGAEPDGAGG